MVQGHNSRATPEIKLAEQGQKLTRNDSLGSNGSLGCNNYCHEEKGCIKTQDKDSDKCIKRNNCWDIDNDTKLTNNQEKSAINAQTQGEGDKVHYISM